MAEASSEADVEFGKLLKQARDQAQLSTAQLAAMLYVARESVDRYMRGERRPPRDVVTRWEEFCRLEPGALLEVYARLPPRRPRFGRPGTEELTWESPDAPSEVESSVQGSRDRETPTASPIRARHPGVLLAAFAFAIVAVAASFVIGRSVTKRSDERTSGSLIQAASNDDLRLRVPADWRRLSPESAFRPLGLSDPIVFAADHRSNSGVMAGVTRATGVTLLMAAMRRRLRRIPSRDSLARLGSGDGYRYLGQHVRDFPALMTIFVAPTTAGTVTLACHFPSHDALKFREICEQVARSLRVMHGRAFGLTPRRDYQRPINRLLAQLDADRQRHRAKLRSSSTRERQANAAHRLALAYARGRERAMRVVASPQEAVAHRHITRALTRARDAYTLLENAARAGGARRYRRAAKQVDEADNSLEAALSALAALGYRISDR